MTAIAEEHPGLRRKRRFEPIALVGLVGTVLLHGGLVAGAIYVRRARAAEAKPPEAGSFVVAQLVRLGKKRDPKKLPDRIVPQAATRKPQGVSYDADADDAPNVKKKKNRDAQLADRLRHSLDKAALLSKAAKEIEAEGDPRGVRGGSATKGGKGDLYMTRIADIWNRTWSLPSIIPREKAKTLYVLVVLRIDKKGKIQLPVKFDRKSGNRYFDASVSAAWQRIGTIPLPPPDRLAAILANGMKLKLNWKGLR